MWRTFALENICWYYPKEGKRLLVDVPSNLTFGNVLDIYKKVLYPFNSGALKS